MDQSYRWRDRGFCFRVALSSIVVPLALNIPMLFLMRDSSWQDRLGILAFAPFNDIIGTPAMIILGIPLLYLYLLFGLTGYIPFMIGGAGCVLAVFNAITPGPVQPAMSAINGVSGAICGLVFRVILFGFRLNLVEGQTDEQRSRRGLTGSKAEAGVFLGILIVAAVLLYYSADHHASISKVMNVTCESVQDTPHQEQVRLVYRENPRFVERLAGPSLCAELRKSGANTAEVTFDVWHNWKTGRGGYIARKISIGGKRQSIFGAMVGGFYPDPSTYEQYTASAPDPDRFADFPLRHR